MGGVWGGFLRSRMLLTNEELPLLYEGPILVLFLFTTYWTGVPFKAFSFFRTTRVFVSR